MKNKEALVLVWSCGLVIGFILGVALAGNFSHEEDYENNQLEPRCYEDVNDRTCRDIDSNTRECWNVPRRVSISCDVNVALSEGGEK